MRTLVITPPFLESFRPPISGAIICAVAKQAGHDVIAWDPNIKLYNKIGGERFYEMLLQFNGLQPVDPNNETYLDQFLEDYDYSGFDYILISIFSQYEIACSRKILDILKKRGIRSQIILGGSGVELLYDLGYGRKFGQEMLAQGLCSHYVIGEGEVALQHIFNGKHDYPGIDGRAPTQIQDVDSLPHPEYDYYDITKYNYPRPEQPDLFVYGSRGCVRRCSFCDVGHYWPSYRYRSGKNIAQELLSYWEKYGIKNFYFTDSLLNGSMKAFAELHESLANMPGLPKLHIAGFAIIRPKNQHPQEMFDMLANTGTHLWSIGVEHGSDAMRMDMRKKFSNDDIEWHLEQSERIGLGNHWLLMPTWVNERMEHHREYLDMFKKWKRYVASGTITSLTIAESLSVIDNTPLTQDHHYNMQFHDSNNNVMRELLWTNKDNPELTIKERHRRSLAIFEAALANKWPVSEAQRKLLAFESIVKQTINLTQASK